MTFYLVIVMVFDSLIVSLFRLMLELTKVLLN